MKRLLFLSLGFILLFNGSVFAQFCSKRECEDVRKGYDSLQEMIQKLNEDVNQMKGGKSGGDLIDNVFGNIFGSKTKKITVDEAMNQLEDEIKKLKDELINVKSIISSSSFASPLALEVEPEDDFEEPVNVSSKYKQIIDQMEKDGIIVSDKVYKAMSTIELKYFDDGDHDPLDLELLLSALAKDLNLLAVHLKRGDRVLDVVHYSTLYYAACLAVMLGPRGSVVTLVNDQEEVAKLQKEYSYLLDSGRVRVIFEPSHEKRRQGYPAGAPYDVVFGYNVRQLSDQIKPGGKLFYPIVNKAWKKTGQGIVEIFR